MKTTASLLFGSILSLSLLVPSAARADLHAGVGFGFVAGSASSDNTDAFAFNPTLHVDLGARLSPTTAVYARGEIGGIVFANQAALYLVGEWRPFGWLSVGSGVGWDGMASMSFSEAMPALVPGGHPIDYVEHKGSWSAISIPLIVGFTIGHRDGHALRLDLEGAGGYEPASGTYGVHATLSFGWSWN